MKDFKYWKKLHESENLAEFSSDVTGLLWLKTKSIVRKELMADFIKINKIPLQETALAKQFVELFDWRLPKLLRQISGQQVCKNASVLRYIDVKI
jgi:hypothetical protein